MLWKYWALEMLLSEISFSLVNGESVIFTALSASVPAVTAICCPSAGSMMTVPVVRTACVSPSAVTSPPEMVTPMVALMPQL